ncbi:MAG: enoyl-CoA hydratase/isomerase family protein [Alphaproteobacteria bacterium]|nr:enoyl-CoA hydratase/isomerase family protein [Alphaproteobacteria bacterium]
MTDTAASGSRVELSIADQVATITFNRPEVRNAIDDAMRSEFQAALEQAANDDGVRAVILTGKGSAFCAGGDIAGMQKRLSAAPGDVAFNGWTRPRRLHQGVVLLHNMPKPTIAAVNGAAAGLGCDLALCCDFIMASETAMFTMSFILRGLVPDGGGMYFLPRRVGLARAKELIFSGRRVDAKEALAIGLADRVTASNTLLADARAWALELGRGSPTALALAKSILDQTYELTADQALALGREAQAICYTSAEHQAAVAAFLDKSKRQR